MSQPFPFFSSVIRENEAVFVATEQSSRICSRMGLVVPLPKRQLQLVHQIRPKFPQHIKSHIGTNVHAKARSGWTQSTAVSGMIGVGQSGGRRSTKPFREINHP